MLDDERVGLPAVAWAGAAAWLEELQALAVRCGGLGIGPELAALSLVDLWGVYRFLSRTAVEAQT